MLESLKNKRILLVVAHPDDELLGVGATMHKLIHEHSSEVRVVILGEGITSRSDKRNTRDWKIELELHRRNIESAQKIIGFESVGIYDFPDNRFDSVHLLDIVKVVEKEKSEFKPEVIFTHHGGDVNIDHQRTFEAVITATRPMADEDVRMIVTFETPSGTEWRASSDPKHFIPNVFCEISKANLEAKIVGMECYEYEKRAYPHPRSPEALRIRAQFWGMSVGTEYAESFMLIRSVT
ncbi:MAG: PIG-L family deacetylase [Cyclobacteriaceae bacterium]